MTADRLRQEKYNKVWFWLGLLAVTATLIPCMLLGEDAVFTYHDQLDGELIAYLLQARHLFRGSTIPEFMGGMAKTALVPPAPLAVAVFLGGNGCRGLMILLIAGKLVGYIGMYLLCKETVRESWVAAAVGTLYALIPFLPVYGLSQFGIPLLFWCVLQLGKRRRIGLSFLYIALYTGCSSLVLVGFGLLGMGLVLLIWEVWKRKAVEKRVETKRDGTEGSSVALPAGAWLLMLFLYAAENFRLLKQVAGIGEVSHKAEYVLGGSPFFPALFRNFMLGGQHSLDGHIWLCAVSALAALICLLRSKVVKEPLSDACEAVLLRTMGFCLGWNGFFSLAAALWSSAAGVSLRGRLNALGAFQLDRLLWIAPCLWYLFAACGIAMIWRRLRERKKAVGGICMGLLAAAALCFTGAKLLLDSDVKSNVQKLRNPDYKMFSFRDYYAIGVMDQVEEFLYRETGQEQEEYRVVSLGIDPAAALYHGFYCLDGYSNNYSLEYKHAFRRILLPELEKSDYLKEYFDGWGNRCYLFSSECPGYYTIEKNGFFFQNYQLDAEALREMGGNYLFSAAYIMNAEEQGLILMREEPFETADSYYRIFVYEVDPDAVRAER